MMDHSGAIIKVIGVGGGGFLSDAGAHYFGDHSGHFNADNYR